MLQRVVRSTVIDAPIERVWAVIRDFNSHDQWHDVVDASRIEAGEKSDQVGCVRSFSLKDGHRIREQLLTLDDRHHRSTYCIVEATVPLERYVATVTLKPVTDGNRTFWHWESSFATPPGMERELREMVARGVYEAGFENLRRHLAAGGDLRAPGAATAAPMPRALPVATRRIVVSRYGESEVLQAVDGEATAPGPGELRIRQRAVGVNFIDIYLRRGWIPDLLAEGGSPGMEAAGVVLDVGEGVTGFMPGDRVAYVCPQPGSYRSVRTLPAVHAVRLPAAIDFDTAAALLLKGLTAQMIVGDLGALDRPARSLASPRRRVLVHAAAGGVGLLVCSWARRLGATVIGTVSSDEKAQLARRHGCEHVIVTRDYRFAAEVQRGFGGADLIVDGLGDAAFDENFEALAPCGHWVSLGNATGSPRALDPNRLVHKAATFSRPVVMATIAPPGALAERATALWAALADGTITLPPIERHTLEAAAEAQRRLEQRRTTGALVLLA